MEPEPRSLAAGVAAVQVVTLGGFRVVVLGRTLDSNDWRRKQARKLFKALLSCPQRRMLKEQAIELLWPEVDTHIGSANLRPVLSALRHALEPVQLLVTERDALGIDPAADMWVDADKFEEALARANSSPDPLPLLERADALYAGDYLPEDAYEDWAEERRERLKRAWRSLQARMVRLAEARHEPDRAIVALERLLSADASDESVALDLMQRHARSGHRAKAVRVYAQLVQALRELDLEPSSAALELRRQIASSEAVPNSSNALHARPPARSLSRNLGNRLTSSEPVVEQESSLLDESTPLVGREDDLVQASAQLLKPNVRLLTLIGPGGSGKTRLAVALGRRLHGSFHDGVVFVDLSPVRDASLVLLAVAGALGLKEAGRIAIRDLLLDFLREQQALLVVLDNFEHVLTAAPVVAEMLSGCPGVKVLVTSRAPLHLRIEHQRFVPPLAVPRPSARDMEEISQSPAVVLFAERATLVDSNFTITLENCRAIAQLCSALDGLPLAIELAGARIRVLPPIAMLQRLSSRLALLSSGPRDAPERHQSLRAAIDWSYELLTLEQQALLRRLSVFAGGATLDAMERVCFTATVDASHVLDTLAALVNGSLVLTRSVAGERVRYDLLQTVREYGAEKLRDAAEVTNIEIAHANYFLELAEAALPRLVSHDQRQWLDVLDLEHDNLRAALRWLLADGDPAAGLRLAAALWRFWWLRGHIGEGQKWLDLALARSVDATPLLHARILEGAANLARVRGQIEYAASLADEDVRICRSVNDSAGLAQALIGAGNVAFDGSDWAAAGDLYLEALGLKRKLAERRGIAMALHNLAEVEYRLGSDAFGPLAEESLSIFQEVGDRWGMALARNDLARVARLGGEYSAARALYQQSLGLLVELGDRWSLAECLEELAELFHAEGEPLPAASLLGISDALREDVGGPRNTSDQSKYDRLKNELRGLLGLDAFTSAWSALQGLPLAALANVLDLQQLGPRG